jgi:hypothetical protein
LGTAISSSDGPPSLKSGPATVATPAGVA